jgi:hypothetical protein
VNVFLNGSQLRVIINFDGRGNVPSIKTLIFEHVVAFEMRVIPGINMVDVALTKADRPMLRALIEYPDSELAFAWRKHFSGTVQIKHYDMYFLHANKAIVVLAKEVRIE